MAALDATRNRANTLGKGNGRTDGRCSASPRSRRQSPHLCDAWYPAAGKSLHVDGMKPFLPDGAREVITTIGIPESAVDDAIADPTTTDEVRADHERCVREYGGFGVPTIVLDGKFAGSAPS